MYIYIYIYIYYIYMYIYIYIHIYTRSFVKLMYLKSSLFNYSDAYILASGNISVKNKAAPDASANNFVKEVVFEN